MKVSKFVPVKLLLMALCFWLFYVAPAFAQNVRIGLFYDSGARVNNTIVSSELSNDGGFKVSLKFDTTLALPVIYSRININAGGQYVQIAASQSFNSAYAQASEAKQKWAYNAYVAYIADNSSYPYKVLVEGASTSVKTHYPSCFSITLPTNYAVVKDISSAKEIGLIAGNVPMIFEPRSSAVTRVLASGKTASNYEGSFEIKANSGKISIINILNVEKYIIGVVPYEMSDYWPVEALKAQAVAARSYTIVYRNKHTSLGFDLCDSPACCQKYAGYNAAYTNSIKAVNETAGLVALSGNRVAQLYYHSNSGGHTENSEDVWITALSYARAVSDPYSISDPLLKNLVSRANNNSEYPARWLRSFHRTDLEAKLASKTINVGTLLDIKSVKRSAGGRHLEILIKGTQGDYTVTRGATRTVFDLSSSLYDIIPIHQRVHVLSSSGQKKEINISDGLHGVTVKGTAPTGPSKLNVTMTNGMRSRTVSKVPLGFSFDGRGWGHGVGMSQWGAFEMARRGYTYRQILEYYFQGITIGTM